MGYQGEGLEGGREGGREEEEERREGREVYCQMRFHSNIIAPWKWCSVSRRDASIVNLLLPTLRYGTVRLPP